MQHEPIRTPSVLGELARQVANFFAAKPDLVFREQREQNSIFSGLSTLVGLIATIAFGIFSYLRVGWAEPPDLVVRAPAIFLCCLICPYLGYVYFKYVSMVHHEVLGAPVRRLASAAIFLPSALGVIFGISNVDSLCLGIVLVVAFLFATWFSFMFRSRVGAFHDQLIMNRPTPSLSQDQVSVDRLRRTSYEWIIINSSTAAALACVIFLYPYEALRAAAAQELNGDHTLITLARTSFSGTSRIGWLLLLLVAINRISSASRSEAFADHEGFRLEITRFNEAWSLYRGEKR